MNGVFGAVGDGDIPGSPTEHQVTAKKAWRYAGEVPEIQGGLLPADNHVPTLASDFE